MSENNNNQPLNLADNDSFDYDHMNATILMSNIKMIINKRR